MIEYIFFFEEEGVNGENSFIVHARSVSDAFDIAFERYGPQVHDMYCKPKKIYDTSILKIKSFPAQG